MAILACPSAILNSSRFRWNWVIPVDSSRNLWGMIKTSTWTATITCSFCECNNFKEARSEQRPMIALGFDIGPLAQYLARRILEIMLADYPLLNCFVRDEAAIALHKVFVHGSDRCARLGSCLSGCFFRKREAFIPARAQYISRSHLDLH